MTAFFVDLGFALIGTLALGYGLGAPDPLGPIQMYLGILLIKPFFDGFARVIDKT